MFLISKEWFAVINLFLIVCLFLYVIYFEAKFNKKFLRVMARRDKYLMKSLNDERD